MGKNVTTELREFSEFLNITYEFVISKIKKRHNDDYDVFKQYEIFVQANWEILIEMLICGNNQYLDYYSGGADLHPLYERVILPEKDSSSRIVINVPKGVADIFTNRFLRNNMTYDFDKFVSFDGKYFDEIPPFDKVMVEDQLGEKLLFNIDEIKFYHIQNVF